MTASKWNVDFWRGAFGFKILVPGLLLFKRIFKRIDSTCDNEKKMINVGAGIFVKRHWLNLDYRSQSYPYQRSLIDIDFDLTSDNPFPFSDNSVKLFYCSHTLEHIPQIYCDHIFSEFYRCLKPGGGVRVTMPNFDYIYNAYKSGRTDFWGPIPFESPEEALCFAIASDLLDDINAEEICKRVAGMQKAELGDYITSLVEFDPKTSNFGHHRNWFNFDKLQQCFSTAGFTEIYESGPLHSRFVEMRDAGQFCGIERFARMPGIRGFDEKAPEKSVFAEAVK